MTILSELIGMLQELCQLKHHKDTVGKDDFYKINQPLAWKKANDLLNRLSTKPYAQQEAPGTSITPRYTQEQSETIALLLTAFKTQLYNQHQPKAGNNGKMTLELNTETVSELLNAECFKNFNIHNPQPKHDQGNCPFYFGDLNTERIRIYKRLHQLYLVQEGTTRDIFNAGIDFAYVNTDKK